MTGQVEPAYCAALPVCCLWPSYPPAAVRSACVTSSRSLLLLIAALAVGAALTQARASPLDADTCNKMMVEQGTLETAGVEQDLAKGPEWAKSNLSADKIAQIRRFIELEELILFRCRSKSRVVLRPDPEEQEAKEREAKEKEAREKEAKEKDQAKDGQHKGAANKQETVFPKTDRKSVV